jgi:hypothetical protein
MKVTTINPVMVNGKHESEPSKYLSANGMGEYETTQANYVKQALNDDFYNAEGDDFYGFDASGKPTKSDEVKMFQKWLVAKGVDISFKNKKGQLLSGAAAIDGDMKKGTKTAKAWDTYGAEWVGVMKKLGFAIGNIGNTVDSGGGGSTPSTAEQVEQAKKGKIWDKAKGWIQSDSAKDLLAKLQAAGGIRGLFGSIFGSKGGGAGFPSTDASPINNSGGGGSGDGGGTPPPPPKGLSKGMKIGIAVGAVVVLGIIIYVATRPKTSVATPIAK